MVGLARGCSTMQAVSGYDWTWLHVSWNGWNHSIATSLHLTERISPNHESKGPTSALPSWMPW